MIDKHETFALMVEEKVAGTPVLNERLKYYLDRPVRELITLDAKPVPEAQRERHRLYSRALMALTYHYWNGNKNGRNGQYPWNEPASAADGKYLDRDYLGHNIAALAVDGDGRIIDFDFNHNKIFNSSIEHAEARLIRRVYGLTQIHDSWNTTPDFPQPSPKDDYSTFENVTVYTSLESCSQCAGIMALGRVKEIIYLQSDPGMYLIGNILRNLTLDTKLQAPLPVAASEVDLLYFNRLNDGYIRFSEQVAERPFYIPKEGKPDISKSITSFLCTKAARDIYGEATRELDLYASGAKQLNYPEYKPVGKDGQVIETAMTNQQSIKEVMNFLSYAFVNGRRGTPH
jgi:tRNA(Arg) A34 adenosine deaminase TadA